MEETNVAPASFAESTFPRNAWYAAAWDTDVKGKLLPRTLCGRPVVLYRTRAGNCVALEDACWHRLLPLSMGKLEADEITCGYHGLVFNSSGRCTHMPSQQTINPSACVRSYPLVERHRFVWIWMGDASLADESLVPDLHWNEDPDWIGDGSTIHAECNYKLVLDNLMDLTHETYVHGSSIGNRSVAESPFEVTHGANRVTLTRWMKNIEAPPFWGKMLGKPGRVDRWQIIRFEAPSTIAIDVGVAVAGTGAPEGDRSQGINAYVLNTVTPETETTSHYFWSITRNYRLGEQRLTTEFRNAVMGIFHEDEIILKAQQQAILSNPGKRFYNLNIDTGAMWVRDRIDAMLAKERQSFSLAGITGHEQLKVLQ